MNSDLRLVFHPQTSLHQASKKVTEFNDELKTLAEQMGKSMYQFDGVGLAAPQIGKNICLVVVTDGDKGYHAYVNPEITFVSKQTDMSEEGCLSVPKVFGFVPRAHKIRFSYQDLDGNKHKEKAKGMKAIIVQHEVDHLKGRLFLDSVKQIFEGQKELEELEGHG